MSMEMKKARQGKITIRFLEANERDQFVDATLLGDYCGRSLPNMLFPPSIKKRESALFVKYFLGNLEVRKIVLHPLIFIIKFIH